MVGILIDKKDSSSQTWLFVSQDITLTELCKLHRGNILLWNDLILNNFDKEVLPTILQEDDLELPFYEIYEKYKKIKPVEILPSCINVYNDIKIKFHKTIKVPSDNKSHPLPPTLGTYDIQKENDKLYLAMRPHEAMWISFQTKSYKATAVRVFVGNLDAVSGEIVNDELCIEKQNYLSLPTQLWMDGVNVGNGLVRQFVVLHKDDKKTIENQLEQKSMIDVKNNTIRLRVHRNIARTYDNMSVYLPNDKKFIDLYDKPSDHHLHAGSDIYFYKKNEHNKQSIQNPKLKDIGIKDGDVIENITKIRDSHIEIKVKTLTGRTMNFTIDKYATVEELKNTIRESEGIPCDQQRLNFGGREMNPDKLICSYNIKSGDIIYLILRLRGGGCPETRTSASMSCGGFISQKIYPDKFVSDVNMYSKNYAEITIQLTADDFAYHSMNYNEYIKENLPWFELDDDNENTIDINENAVVNDLE